jgi:hypothetical protein
MTEPTPTPTERTVAPGATDDDPAAAFRATLRGWLAAELTPEVAEAGRRSPEEGDLEVLRAWNRTLADAGGPTSTSSWPTWRR